MPLDEITTDAHARGLLDAAIENFRIAREYMDDASCGIEQKLISFHLAIALLAQPKPTSSNLLEAERLLLEARDWDVDQVEADLASNRKRLEVSSRLPKVALPAGAEVQNAIFRIMTEASYNLGVVYELQHDYVRASRAYEQSTSWAQKSPDLAPISILSRFVEISVESAKGEPIAESTRLKIALLREDMAGWQDMGSILGQDNTSKRPVQSDRPKWYQKLRSLLGLKSRGGTPVEAAFMSPSQVSQFTGTLDEIREKLLEIESQRLGAEAKTDIETLDAE